MLGQDLAASQVLYPPAFLETVRPGGFAALLALALGEALDDKVGRVD